MHVDRRVRSAASSPSAVIFPNVQGCGPKALIYRTPATLAQRRVAAAQEKFDDFALNAHSFSERILTT